MGREIRVGLDRSFPEPIQSTLFLFWRDVCATGRRECGILWTGLETLDRRVTLDTAKVCLQETPQEARVTSATGFEIGRSHLRWFDDRRDSRWCSVQKSRWALFSRRCQPATLLGGGCSGQSPISISIHRRRQVLLQNAPMLHKQVQRRQYCQPWVSGKGVSHLQRALALTHLDGATLKQRTRKLFWVSAVPL